MNPDSPNYRLGAIGQFKGQLDGLLELAESRDLQSLLLEVIREMSDRLRRDPREWGDPYRNYRGLHAVGYGRTIQEAGIRIEYAVHDTESIVWVFSIRALPGSPLA